MKDGKRGAVFGGGRGGRCRATARGLQGVSFCQLTGSGMDDDVGVEFLRQVAAPRAADRNHFSFAFRAGLISGCEAPDAVNQSRNEEHQP